MNSVEELEDNMNMSDDEFKNFIIEFQLAVMDVMLKKKLDEGKIVFSGVEDGLLN